MKNIIFKLTQHLHILNGKNKISELARLIDEIARKEKSAPETILKETLADLRLDNKPHWPFSKLKKALLNRRFPLTENISLSSVLLHEFKPISSFSKKKNLTGFSPESLFIQETSRASPLAKKIISCFPNLKPLLFKDLKSLFQQEGRAWKDSGKTRLILSNEKYDFIQACPCTKQAVRCNYYLINLGMGCPFDCSYCYLQQYQNLNALILPSNPEKYLEELSHLLKQHPNKIKRIGTGEFTDSLALDHLTEYSKLFVPFFKDKNVLFELKTKSNRIENLLSLDHGGKTVISWSLNPEHIAQSEEWAAASITERLQAARKCQEAGYPIGIHFDPVIEYADWEKDYLQLIEQLYAHVAPPLRWISLGTLRFSPALKPIAEQNHPDSRLYLGELFRDEMDLKMRYPKERRIKMYQQMIGWIKKYDPQVPVYLCMESQDVWQAVYPKQPYTGRIDHWISQCRNS